jgi:predicted PurR-regulated permease PerM
VQHRRNPWSFLTETRVTHVLKLLLVIVLVLYLGEMLLGFLDRVRAIAGILVGAVFFAYLIYPLVAWLRKWMPMLVAILIVYAGILLVLGFSGWFIIPRLTQDVTQLVQQSPVVAAQLNSAVNDPHNPIVARLPDWMRAEIARAPGQIVNWAQLHGLETAGHAMTVVVGTIAAIATFVIIPLFTAYLLLELDAIKRVTQRVIPPEHHDVTLDLLDKIDDVIGGFVRGQLLVALSVGVLITIALLLLHVPYAFLLGLLAAVGDLIPYVGAILAFTPAFLIAMLHNGWLNAIIVGVVFVAIFEFEGHLLAPNIVSRQVRLSPLIVLVALLIGGELAGIFGMLLAVPVAGAIRVIAVHFFPPLPAELETDPQQTAPRRKRATARTERAS